MKQGKIGVEWLAQLSKEEQILFCKNRVNWGRFSLATTFGKLTIAGYLSAEFSSFQEFIDYAFEWDKTPEGHSYWADISYR